MTQRVSASKFGVPDSQHTVVALIACRNRRRQTLACLERFFDQGRALNGVKLGAVLVDDGSDDGTPDAVAAQFPEVRIIRDAGDLYWARAMAVAEQEALRNTPAPDFLLWLNDDVQLDPGAVALLLDASADLAKAGREAVVVGAVRDPSSDRITYSGLRRKGRHPLRFDLVIPGDDIQHVDTFNGNVVLVPRTACAALGGIDGNFSHGQADIDYGIRARAHQVAVVLAAGTVGTCARGFAAPPWRDNALSPSVRWRLALDRKGIPPRTQARFLRRHGGRMWLVWWISPYAKLTLSCLASPYWVRWLRSLDSKAAE